MRLALHEFLDREVSPRDLIGLITADHSWQDLVIGKRLSAIEQEIDNEEWLRTEPTEEQLVLEGCDLGALRARARNCSLSSLGSGVSGAPNRAVQINGTIRKLPFGITRRGLSR